MKVAVTLVVIAIVIAGIVGEIRCMYKACTCNWSPIGKAEIMYTVGTLSGAGCIVGYFDIEDK